MTGTSTAHTAQTGNTASTGMDSSLAVPPVPTNELRKGLVAAPKCAMPVLQVSTWEQVPEVLKELSSGPSSRVRIDFPEPPAGSPDHRNQIKAFLKESSQIGIEKALSSRTDVPKSVRKDMKSLAEDLQYHSLKVSDLHTITPEVVQEPAKVNAVIAELVENGAASTGSIVSVSPGCECEFAQALEAIGSLDKLKAREDIKIWVGDQSLKAAADEILPEAIAAVKELSLKDFIEQYGTASKKDEEKAEEARPKLEATKAEDKDTAQNEEAEGGAGEQQEGEQQEGNGSPVVDSSTPEQADSTPVEGPEEALANPPLNTDQASVAVPQEEEEVLGQEGNQAPPAEEEADESDGGFESAPQLPQPKAKKLDQDEPCEDEGSLVIEKNSGNGRLMLA
jgi:hypothetical protein